MGADRRLGVTGRMKELMLRHIQAGWTAREQGRKVAWVTSGAPVEFLHALDIVPVYPENHGALCGTARAGGALCRSAEERGYPRDLCSYWRIDEGSRANPGGSPIGGLPAPDLLLCANNICRTVVKWYEGISRRLGVPLVVLDTPFLHDGEDSVTREYVRAQFRRLPGTLSAISGSTWSAERFRETVALSRGASQAWEECLVANSARPAPATAFDFFILMGPIVTLRGTPEAVAFYEAMRDELRDRASRGEGAVERETFRLLWDNLPLWHRLRPLSEFLSSRGAVLAGATYAAAWAERPATDGDGIEATADAYARVWLNTGLTARERAIRGLVSSLGIDGVLFHANRSCKPYSFGQDEIAAHLSSEGLPCLVIDGDMADERDFAWGGWEVRLEAFLERIANRR